MMRPVGVAKWVVWSLLIVGGAAAGAEDRAATRELFRLTPADMSACIVVEDAAAHIERFLASPLKQQIDELPLVKRWKDSAQYQGFLQAQALIPLYFGLTPRELGVEILGKSVVLAFRPGKHPGQDDVGVILCRAADESALDRLVKTVTLPNPGRKVETRQHRGVAYYHRIELDRRPDFLVRIGMVGALCDRESVVHAIIEASQGGPSLWDQATFREMRESTPEDSIVSFLVLPRAFEEQVATSVHRDSPFGRAVMEFWRALDWGALSLRTGGGLHVGVHLKCEAARLGQVGRRWMDLLKEPRDFWKNVPAGSLAAAVLPLDGPSLVSILFELLPKSKGDELHRLAAVFRQLLPAYDVSQDLLPRMGPHLGILVTGPTEEAPIMAVARMELRDVTPTEAGALTLSRAVEFAGRPVLVLMGLEQNRVSGDELVAATILKEGVRVHALTGTRLWPQWFVPSFSVHDGAVYLASNPAAIRDWTKTPAEPFLESRVVRELAKRLSPDYVPVLYADVSKIRELCVAHRSDLARQIAGASIQAAGRIAGKRIDGAEEAASEAARAVSDKLDEILALSSLVDRLCVGTYSSKGARHWSVSLLPRLDDPAPAAPPK